MELQATKQEFMELVQQHQGIIGKICNAYCSIPARRPDLAQEIIYQLWKSYPRYNGSVRFSTWLYKVALNTAINEYRQEKNRGMVTPLEAQHYYTADNTGSEKEQQFLQLQTAIQQLPPLDRALLLLYLEDRPYAEIAGIMGLSEGNVATKLSRLRQQLKQKINILNKQ